MGLCLLPVTMLVFSGGELASRVYTLSGLQKGSERFQKVSEKFMLPETGCGCMVVLDQLRTYSFCLSPFKHACFRDLGQSTCYAENHTDS